MVDELKKVKKQSPFSFCTKFLCSSTVLHASSSTWRKIRRLFRGVSQPIFVFFSSAVSLQADPRDTAPFFLSSRNVFVDKSKIIPSGVPAHFCFF